MMSRNTNQTGSAAGDVADLVTLNVGGQVFGIPVLQVRDVLSRLRIARVPLAPREVAGVLNLRGRIVTTIEMRERLGLPARSPDRACMSVVVEYRGEPYSLLVDSVGEVVSLKSDSFEPSPATLSHHWRDLSRGIHRLDGSLLIVLDVDRLLDFGLTSRAA